MRLPVLLLSIGVFAAAFLALLEHGEKLRTGPTIEEPGDAVDVPQEPTEAPVVAPSRAVAPSVFAKPQGDGLQLARAAPRPPLSDIGQARTPRRKTDDWGGIKLDRPMVIEAGRVNIGGYQLVIAGIEPLSAAQTCSGDGRDWPCGVFARTAFRSFLRGRSLSCLIPPEAVAGLIVAPCRLGKQDIGQWLVENGWAHASAGGQYDDLAAQARSKRKGMFGAAPDTGQPVPAAQPL